MRLNPLELLSRLNSSYWFVPAVVTTGGAGLALGLLALDARVDVNPGGFAAILFPTSPEGARALLSAVIGATITAISITFSMALVAFTVASQHFGPRVLNSYVRHTSAQAVLGTFIGTFVYAVLVLGSVRGTDGPAGVPQASVFGAVCLVLVSVIALLYYLYYVANALQVGELTSEIAHDFRASVRRLHAGAERGTQAGDTSRPSPPADAGAVRSDATGYVQRIDHAALASACAPRGAVVWIQREPGTFVIAGAPLALVHPGAAVDDELVRQVNTACVVGRDRTHWHDAEFAVKQLVEIALRALSPGVNEPFTATTCIDRLTEGLAEVLRTPPPRACWRDADGTPRVYVEPQRFPTLLRAAFDPIRVFGGSNPAIYARLLQALGALASVAARGDDLDALQHQLDVVRRAADASLTDVDDRAFVEQHVEEALAAMAARRRDGCL